jgi:hypothetical protein
MVMKNHLKNENFELVKKNGNEFIFNKYYNDIQQIHEINKIEMIEIIKEILKQIKIQTIDDDVILFDLKKQ